MKVVKKGIGEHNQLILFSKKIKLYSLCSFCTFLVAFLEWFYSILVLNVSSLHCLEQSIMEGNIF